MNDKEEISVLNEAFKVGKEFISEYVLATICLKKTDDGGILPS